MCYFRTNKELLKRIFLFLTFCQILRSQMGSLALVKLIAISLHPLRLMPDLVRFSCLSYSTIDMKFKAVLGSITPVLIRCKIRCLVSVMCEVVSAIRSQKLKMYCSSIILFGSLGKVYYICESLHPQ